jgi:hypothetical protein
MLKKIFFLCLLFVSSQVIVLAQTPETDDMYFWKILSKVKYKSNLDAESGEVIYTPIFGKSIEAYEGKIIFLKGYIIPAEMSKGKMTLSAFPYSSCFFCGGAGPESVIELETKSPIIYRLEKPITLQGKLKLNRTDPLRLMYVLDGATYYQAK